MRNRSNLLLQSLAMMASLVMVQVASAQSQRMFLVPAGDDPSTTTPNTRATIEVVPGGSVNVDVYLETTSGGSIDTAGFQFSLACSSTGGGGDAITYSPESVTVTSNNLASCTTTPFEQNALGSCPPDSPGGLVALEMGQSCSISTAVKIGSARYTAPFTASTPDAAGNPYIIDFADGVIADANQAGIPNLILDGLTVTICPNCPPIPAASVWSIALLFLLLLIAATLCLVENRADDAACESQTVTECFAVAVGTDAA